MVYLEGSGILPSLQVSLCTMYVAQLCAKVRSSQASPHYATWFPRKDSPGKEL